MLRLVVLSALAVVSLTHPQRFTSSERSSESLSLLRPSQRNSQESIEENIRFNPAIVPFQDFGSTLGRATNQGRTINNFRLSPRNSEESIEQNIRFNPILPPRQELSSSVVRTPSNYRSIVPTPSSSPGCPAGQIRDYVGACVFPDIIRDLYVFAEPDDSESEEDLSYLNLPKPTVKYNLVVIRADEDDDDGDGPIVIPPPQEKTLVLVLKKEDEDGPRKVIEIPAGPDQRPEVFFIKYDEEDNAQLPGGITLQEALQHSISAGQSVGDAKSYGQH